MGSGPAGLAAAYDLCIQGFGVTIFEALPVAGGMLAVGIPEYRLPKKFLEHDIEQIRKMGVEIRLNTRIQNIDDLFAGNYKAIFLAVGAHGERSMNIPGEKLKGVFRGTEFLKDLNSGQSVDLGKKGHGGGRRQQRSGLRAGCQTPGSGGDDTVSQRKTRYARHPGRYRGR